MQEDKELDAESVRPGQMVFEKLVSGLYLGEIVRRVILTLVKQSGILEPAQCSRLEIPDTFSTKMMSAIDQDVSIRQETIASTLMLAFGLTQADCSWVLCNLVRTTAVNTICILCSECGECDSDHLR